jgi:class 3 adenylate cyclase/HEAT repeat protein
MDTQDREDPKDGAAQPAVRLGEEPSLTLHRLIEAFDREKRYASLVEGDLFDSRSPVVLSAVSVLVSIGSPTSFKYLVRLLSHADEEVQRGAISAIGRLNHPLAPQTLLSFFKTSQNELLRGQALEALAAASPRNEELSKILTEYAYSPLVSRETRLLARRLLLQTVRGPAAEKFLAEMREEVLDLVYDQARQDGEIAEKVLQHGRTSYARLSSRNRSQLIRAAVDARPAEAVPLLFQALEDVDPEVRRTAYQTLGGGDFGESTGRIVEVLSQRVEPTVELEEEAQQAILRIDRGGIAFREAASEGRPRGGAAATLRRKILQQAQELLQQLRVSSRRPTSDTHELGWLITRSREYVEYYVDAELKNALISFLKGSPNYGPAEMLKKLKESAVRVEVRHFEGYNALCDIIKNPKRPGISLVSRELAITRLGKRDIFYRLIRNMLILALLWSDPPAADESEFVLGVYTWAREAKLFRLAEAALYALSKYNQQRTVLECRRCLSIPVASKILAIAAIRLANALGEKEFEAELAALIASGSDEEPYITLNIVDSLSVRRNRLPGQLSGALLHCFHREHGAEVLARIADCLGEKADSDLLEGIYKVYFECDAAKQELLLVLIDKLIRSTQILNREALVEFLYRILHSSASGAAAQIGIEVPAGAAAPIGTALPALLLWKLGDSYALQLLRDAFRTEPAAPIVAALRLLRGETPDGLIPALAELLAMDDRALQEALRGVLLDITDPEGQARILQAAVGLRGVGAEGTGAEPEREESVEIDFLQQRKTFRFERDHIQELVILFTDIQGYTKKAQTLSAMQLAALIQEYERILIPVMRSHFGQLIKTMGDGHLFVFENPLHAVLAAIRFQKSMKRFNTYKEEALRLTVRIGIHAGKVIRKKSDILGNNVNIAARLERSASGGSVLISKTVYENIREFVHAREIGLLQVKGVAEPIKVFEPCEIALELPADRDPLKADRKHEPESPAAKGRTILIDASILDAIFEAFSAVGRLCLQAQAGKTDVLAIRQELVRRWNDIRARLLESGAVRPNVKAGPRR